MPTLLTLFGALFAAIGTVSLLIGGAQSGFMAWTCAAVFFVGGALVQELRERLPRPDRPPAPKGPGDLHPRESWVSRIFG